MWNDQACFCKYWNIRNLLSLYVISENDNQHEVGKDAKDAGNTELLGNSHELGKVEEAAEGRKDSLWALELTMDGWMDDNQTERPVQLIMSIRSVY
jgi:hypothetical protein